MSDDTPPPYGEPTPPPPPGGDPTPPPAPPPYGQPTPPPPPAAGATPPPPPYGAAMPAAFPYADWGKRFLAYLIDNLAPIAAILVVGAILQAIFPSGLEIVAIIGWIVWNYGMQQGETGYSIGKGVVGIKLISEESGQPIGTGMAIARYFVHIVDSIPCYVGFLWPLWDQKRQTFADKILKTVVIVQPKG